MINFILLIIKYGPQVFSLVSEIYALIKRLTEPAKVEAFKGDLKAATVAYKTTKDRRPLKAVRDRLYDELDNATV